MTPPGLQSNQSIRTTEGRGPHPSRGGPRGLFHHSPTRSSERGAEASGERRVCAGRDKGTALLSHPPLLPRGIGFEDTDGPSVTANSLSISSDVRKRHVRPPPTALSPVLSRALGHWWHRRTHQCPLRHSPSPRLLASLSRRARRCWARASRTRQSSGDSLRSTAHPGEAAPGSVTSAFRTLPRAPSRGCPLPQFKAT